MWLISVLLNTYTITHNIIFIIMILINTSHRRVLLSRLPTDICISEGVYVCVCVFVCVYVIV